MALLNYCCFAGKKKQVKGKRRAILDAKNINECKSLEAKLEHPGQSSENVELNSTSCDVSLPSQNISEESSCNVKATNPEKPIEREPKELNTSSFNVSEPSDIPERSTRKVKIMDPESPSKGEAKKVTRENENKHENKSPIRNDNSQSNPQTCDTVSGRENEASSPKEVAYENENEHENKSPIRSDNSQSNLQTCNTISGSKNESSSSEVVNEHSMEKNTNVEGIDFIQHGHTGDPGMDGKGRCSSQGLRRTCSSLERREVLKIIAYELPPPKSQTFEELQELAEKVKEDVGSPCSRSSALSLCSADKVMLKKHSYSQILPSRSRKIWWKLFLWSHRNLQKPSSAKIKVAQVPSPGQLGGYSSDTVEPDQVKELSKLESSSSSSAGCSYKDNHEDSDAQICDGFKLRVSGSWTQNQWAAFSGETSPLKRVDDWVNEHFEIQCSAEEENDDKDIIFPPPAEISGPTAKGTTHLSSHSKVNLSKELLHANSVIQTLNSSSTVAHISGMGLRIVPMISQFSTLRSVNLSNNYIVQVTPGSLPKGLYFLDLSRNKICNIEGLRELTRLRVLDLSYNRISRLGHGVANCKLLKELYLAGNKISEVEGLHRLHKVTVLDLSFNRITTKKAMGQIVANYGSLLSLNLLGNPIQKNLSDDQLRKAICGLLPKLASLNKQPVNLQKPREVRKDIVAKTTFRSNSLSVHRRLSKNAGQNGERLTSSKSSLGIVQRSRTKLKSPMNKQSSLCIRT